MKASAMLVLVLAGPLAANPTTPNLGSQGGTAVASTSCGAQRFTTSFVQDGKSVHVRLADTTEGWTWDSAALSGKPVTHLYGSGACQSTEVDVDGDGVPEVIVTLDDEAPGGSIYVFRRVAGQHTFAPVPVEVGPGFKPRDFMVWDIPGQATAPVTIGTDGDIQIKSRSYALLDQGAGEALFHYKYQDGMLRQQHTKTAASAAP